MTIESGRIDSAGDVLRHEDFENTDRQHSCIRDCLVALHTLPLVDAAAARASTFVRHQTVDVTPHTFAEFLKTAAAQNRRIHALRTRSPGLMIAALPFGFGDTSKI